MSYVRENLTKGEDIVYEAEIHWSVFVFPVLVLIVGFAAWPFFILGALLVVWAFLKKSTTELAVTNKRVVAKFGVVRRNTIEQRLEKVDSIQVRQGIVGRLWGEGSVIVSGSGLSATPIPNIDNPLNFRNKVNDAIENYVKA